jgi:hypothetical protein
MVVFAVDTERSPHDGNSQVGCSNVTRRNPQAYRAVASHLAESPFPGPGRDVVTHPEADAARDRHQKMTGLVPSCCCGHLASKFGGLPSHAAPSFQHWKDDERKLFLSCQQRACVGVKHATFAIGNDQVAQAPHQPIRADMKEQAHLVGCRPAARRAISGETCFPGLDMIFRLAAGTVDILVDGAAGQAAKAGDDETGIGPLKPSLDAGDDAFNAVGSGSSPARTYRRS